MVAKIQIIYRLFSEISALLISLALLTCKSHFHIMSVNIRNLKPV